MPKYSQVLANGGCEDQRKQVKVCLSNICPAVFPPYRRRFLSCRLSWMILLTNSSSPPSAMISVTPPVFTELGGGRREFLELTPWWEQQDRQRLQRNPIRGLLLSCKQTVLHVMCALTTGLLLTLSEPPTYHQRKLPSLCSIIQKGSRKKIYNMMKRMETPTFASNWLAKNGGLHMQKSYTISVSSFKASINNVFWGTLTTRIEIKQRFPNYEAFCLVEQTKELLKGDKSKRHNLYKIFETTKKFKT